MVTDEEESENMEEYLSDFSRFYILTFLYEGPVHGYSIINRFKKILGKTISPSLVYPFLEQLEKKGLVKHTLEPVGDKPKKVFELTEEGKEACTRLFKRFANLVSIAIEPSLEISPLWHQDLRRRTSRSHQRKRNSFLLRTLRQRLQTRSR